METVKQIVRNGVATTYAVRGATHPRGKTTPPMVFLHGLASNMSRWAELTRATELRANHDLIRLDLRGHGQSLTRTAFTRDDWCADVLALLDTEQAKTAILVGHSLGAQVALSLAATHPKRVAGLCLIDPIFPSALAPTRQSVMRWIPWYARAATLIRTANRCGLYRRNLQALDLEAMDQRARVALQDPEALAAFVKQYSSTREDLKFIPHASYLQDVVELFRPLPPLSDLQCPVLLMRSSQADFHDPQRAQSLVQPIAALETVTIDCHHWPVTEKPEEVRAHLERWVATLRQ